jgi:hypothetical protein
MAAPAFVLTGSWTKTTFVAWPNADTPRNADRSRLPNVCPVLML